MELTFYKYQGAGNDFVMLEDWDGSLANNLSHEDIAKICDRRFGVGADGLILLAGSSAFDFVMVYYNADGRESTMCGNGGRCAVAFAHHLGKIEDACSFNAIDGKHEAHILANGVRLEMIQPYGYRELGSDKHWLHTGSPHYVWFLEENLQKFPVNEKGKEIRYSEDFKGEGGTNVNFVQVMDTNHLAVRTYERGVENETLACGTGVTACAYIHLMNKPLDMSEVNIQAQGGDLKVVVEDMGTETERIWLEGPAEFVFKGTFQLDPSSISV